MLLALLWQALVIQAHVHFAPPTVSVSTQTALNSPASKGGDDPATCPLCREMAHAGLYLPGTPPLIRRPATRATAQHSSLIRRWRTRKRSHAWHSRGPPALAA